MLLKEYMRFERSIAASREIGIEVEMEGSRLPEIVTGWSVKGDGSLRGNAFEYVLPHPVPRKEAPALVTGLYNTFKDFSIKPSDRCGVHIHVNYREQTLEQVFNAITLYLMLEDVLMKWCGDDREGNLFCLRAKDAEWLIYQLIQDKKSGGFVKSITASVFKYASLNLSALSIYGSLEYRGLGTKKEPDNILTWIRILLAIKDYAIENLGKDIISQSCSEGARDFIINVLGRELYNEVKFHDIGEVLLESVRRIQGLFYTKLGTSQKKDFLIYNPIAPQPSWLSNVPDLSDAMDAFRQAIEIERIAQERRRLNEVPQTTLQNEVEAVPAQAWNTQNGIFTDAPDIDEDMALPEEEE